MSKESRTERTMSATVNFVLNLRRRSDKARFARLKLDTLQAAVRAEDWCEAQNAAEQIAQAARWLQLSDAEIENNS